MPDACPSGVTVMLALIPAVTAVAIAYLKRSRRP